MTIVRIMKACCCQARGQSIIRGGAVVGFLQPLRFVSALIAQVKMAAHAGDQSSFREAALKGGSNSIGRPFNNVRKFLLRFHFVFS